MTSAPAISRTGPAAALPPIVPGSFLLGSALDLRRDMLGTFERAFAEQGDVVRFLAGPPGMRQGLYVLFHPDAAHRVLASFSANYRKENVFYSEVRNGFGDSLLTSQDDEWQRQKRFLQPLFRPTQVDGYAADMSEQVDGVARRWRSRPAGTVDLHEEMTRLTLATVCRILFGEDLGRALPVVQREFAPLGEAVLRRTMAPMRLPVGVPSPVNRRLTRARVALYGVCDEIVARRRASGDRQQDMLGLLLDARDGDSALTDTEVRDQVLVFLLAGHETTSTALTFTLDLLGRHPDVQRRVRAEVDAVVGAATPTAQHAAALEYTAMVLKEAMRLYPSAPVIGRQAVADDEICGYRIPAGSDVWVSPWVIHKHPDFWDEPARFDPERFAAGQEKARHRYAWLPFGGGPHACIGQHFSMLESAIAVAMLVREFEFTAPPGEPPYTNHITLRPTHGVPSLVTPV